MKTRKLVQVPTEIKTVVTGTGRCGTVYTAHLLTELGFTCSHEAIFHAKEVEEAVKRFTKPVVMEKPTVNKVYAESSFMAAPFLNHPLLDGCSVVHLVRHPVAVINSFVHAFKFFDHKDPESLSEKELKGNTFQLFIFKHLPELAAEMDVYERAAIFYMGWNRMIEERATGRRYMRHRIEDDPRAIAAFVGIKWKEVKEIKRNGSNSPGMRDTIPDSVVKEQLKVFAAKYGYEV